MANENQKENPIQSLVSRVESLEKDNEILSEVLASCLEVIYESAMMGMIKRSRDGFIKAAQEKLATVKGV